MTFRDALDAALSALELDADPATVLAEHGFVDLPPEVLSSALLHFAERAPLDVADALAPIVTRVSPVPFELDDLPPSPADDVLADGGDVFRLLREVGLADPDLDEADPTGFDADADGDPDHGDLEHDGTAPETSGDADGDAEHTFGGGHGTGSDDPFDPEAFGREDLDPDEAFGDHGRASGDGNDGDGIGTMFGSYGPEPSNADGLESMDDLETFDDQIHEIDQMHDQHDPADLDLD